MASDPKTPHLVHHAPPGVYLKSLDDIRVDLEHWERNCREHDLDPLAWRAKRIDAARAYVSEQRRARERDSE